MAAGTQEDWEGTGDGHRQVPLLLQMLMYILNSVQEYSEQRLLALKKTGKELVMDTFKFPSCYRG